MKKYINTAFVYAGLGLAGGVFYREFTKFNGVEGGTSLAFLHLHLLVLGMFFFLIAALLDGQLHLAGEKLAGVFYGIYNSGLGIMIAAMVTRGVLQVLNRQLSKGLDAAISGIAGIGHILLGTGLIIFFVILRRSLNRQVKK